MKKVTLSGVKEFLKKNSLWTTPLFFIVVTILICFIIIDKIFCSGYFEKSEIEFIITTIKDLFNIFFFGGILTITILSYIQAKKTLFTPIKTETFKMQIKAFEDLLLFFQNKTETDFTKQFDFDKIFAINANHLLFDYIKHFFSKEVKLDEEKIEELSRDSAGAIVSKKYMENHFTKPVYYEKTDKKEKEEITNPAIILKEWEEYEYGKIDFTIKYNDEIEKLKNLMASPLIPNDLKAKINAFYEKTHTNLTMIGDVLTGISKELPKKFPTAKSIDNFNTIGLWNEYNDKMENVEPDAIEILNYIRNYLKIEQLIN